MFCHSDSPWLLWTLCHLCKEKSQSLCGEDTCNLSILGAMLLDATDLGN